MDQFLHKLTIDKPWEILLLPEAIYTRKIQAYVHSTGDGHRVFAMTPQVGQRSCAIIVKFEFSNNILENTFQQHGRACKLDMFFGGRYIRFISAHRWAKSGTAQYAKSFSDVDFLLNMHGPSKFEIVIGADTQDKVGSYDESSSPETVGPYADGPRNQRGNLALNVSLRNWDFSPSTP